MRWVLVEATQRVLPEVDRDMGAYTVQQLLKREAWTSGWTPGWSPASDGLVEALRRRQLPGRHHRLDGRGEAVADAGPRPTCPATSGAGSPACRRSRWSTATGWSRARGAPATAPRCRT